MNHKKIKALFEIFIIVGAIFTISLLNTKDVKAANQACCEKLQSSNDYCIFTDETQCANDKLKQVGTTCENTDFCAIGTCYNTNTGECSNPVSKAKCIAEGGSFDIKPKEELPICQEGCCVRPDGCDITTKNECKVALQSYSQITFEDAFDVSITDETECSNICKSAEVGCWIPDDPASESCKFGFRSEFTGGQFRTGVYCSNVQECESTKEYQKGCLSPQQQQYFDDSDNVYWFDSSGNPEQVVGSIYTGYVDDVKYNSGCNEQNDNVNNPNCGLCDVIGGSVCGTKEVNSKETYQCVSLNCGTGHGDVFKWVQDNSQETGWKFSEQGNNAFDIKNYDSWCYYEGIVGQGRDLVGTRHDLFRCKDGEIIPEYGKTNREEACVMTFNNGRPSAALMPNDASACLTANSDDSSCGGECSGISKEYDRILCCNKQKCENSENLCYWDESVNRCAPQVSVGTLVGNSEINKGGDQICVAVFEYKLLRASGDHWDCIANCECIDKANDFNSYCKSIGDFGVYYNFNGVLGEGGYTFTKDVSKSGINAPTPVNKNDIKYIKNPETFISGDNSLIYKMWYDIFTGEKNIKLGETPEYKSAFSRRFGAGSHIDNPIFILGGFVLYYNAATIGNFFLSSVNSLSFVKLFNGVISAFETLYNIATKRIFQKAGETIVVEEGAKEASGGLIKNIFGETAGKVLGSVLGYVNVVLLVWTLVNIIEIIIGNKVVNYKFTCDPWLAPSGNQNCELCQNDPSNPYAVCDKYRCDSLGAKCEFIGKNPDGSDAETGLCKLTKERDLVAPVITHLKIEENRQIEPIGTEGYNIRGEFDTKNSIVIGVKTDELAACKIHKVRETNFDNMLWFDNEKWQTNHTVELFFTGEDPGQDSLLIFGSGQKEYYVSCKDTSGNIKPNYKIQFKVKEGPDITKPVIIKMDPVNNAYIPYNQESTNLYLLVEEDSGVKGCKYSRTPNTDYENMEGSFTCSSSSTRDSEGLVGYRCLTKLTGLRNNQDNTFYFKCEDNVENVNNQDQPTEGYTLKGSNPLLLESVGPEGKLYERDITLTATTRNGAEGNGKAECRYSLSIQQETDKAFENMFKFSTTDSSTHSHQLINLENGNYYVQVMCKDIGGNEDRKQTTFNVDTPDLNITTVEPLNNSKVYQLPFELKVTTVKGYNNNGDSTCNYKVKSLLSGAWSSETIFLDKIIQETTLHTKEINLGDGRYSFEITCRDSAGKSDKTSINLEINKEAAPQLRRVYTESNLLTIEVSEPSECRYSYNTFNYEDGTPMVSNDNGIRHQATLQNVFYIICENINNHNRNSEPFIIYP